MTDAHLEVRGQLAGLTLGPKMMALDERERIFAFALGSGIASNAAEAARLAKYTNDPKVSRTGKRSNSLVSQAHKVLHRPRVIEAIEEVCRHQFRNLVPLVISAARRVLEDPTHKDHSRKLTRDFWALCGRRGGLQYAQNKTPEQRTEQARKAAKARWRRVS
jgi:hypothetical protein